MWNTELARGNAHDGVRLTVEQHWPVHYRRVAAEALAPEIFADHDDRRGIGAVVVAGEHAPAQRVNAEQREQVPGHALDRDLCGLVGELQEARRRRDGGEPLELPGFP